jgi:hypothetical protein
MFVDSESRHAVNVFRQSCSSFVLHHYAFGVVADALRTTKRDVCTMGLKHSVSGRLQATVLRKVLPKAVGFAFSEIIVY